MDSETVAAHSQIETLATSYVDEIRKIQPSGPYFLSGYSAAGIVAYEMAQQLLSQGEEVGLLAIVESMPFTVRWNATRNLIRRSVRFTRRFLGRAITAVRIHLLARLDQFRANSPTEFEGNPCPLGSSLIIYRHIITRNLTRAG